MKKIAYTALSLLFGTTVLTACSDDNTSKNGYNAAEGDAINFNLERSLRTVYDADDDYQIDWLWGEDKVRIYCAQAQKETSADYTVVQKTTGDNKDKKNIGTLQYNENGLRWSTDDKKYNFYAVYPADDSRVSVSDDGIATFKINQNQTCTVNTTTSTEGNYIADPDMQNAYMVASQTNVDAYADAVNLTFKPIMTTLKVVVKGVAADNDADVTVTGISVISPAVVSTDAVESEFQYDIANGTIVGNTGDNASATSKTETTSCQLSNTLTDGTTEKFVTLKANETVTMTIFLPPLPINAEKKVTIRVHATGKTTQQVTFGSDSQQVNASAKATIKLPNYPTEQKGNNWITPLDDNIYVCQLSIPGTHDAATGEGMATIVGTALGETQDLTINEQINMGIRAFDLRPAYSTDNSEFYIYHGLTRTQKSFAAALGDMVSYLKDNPGEFFIVWMRHESETVLDLDSGKDIDKWKTDLAQAIKDAADGYVATFKPDLTIGEARGKILFLTRDDFTGYADLGVGYVSPFSTGQSTVMYDGKITCGSSAATLHYQDMYNNLDETNKITLVKELLDKSATYHSDDENTLTWVVNHTSGYTSSVSTTENYLQNAENTNKPFYDYLVGSEKPVGSTGIILSDFVGSRTRRYGILFTRTYNTYGDLLPQAIIDNNYKYRMKRKGE